MGAGSVHALGTLLGGNDEAARVVLIVFPHTRFFSMEISLPMESTPKIWDGME